LDKKGLLILVAGAPGAGKTTFARFLGEQLGLPVIHRDSIKEILFDTVKYTTREETMAFGVASGKIMEHVADCLLKTGQTVILESNFDNYSKSGMEKLVNKFNCNVLIVRLRGDTRVLYERFKEREKSPERHSGHKWDLQVSFEWYEEYIKSRGFAEFFIGDNNIDVDVTDFNKVLYDLILNEIKEKAGLT